MTETDIECSCGEPNKIPQEKAVDFMVPVKGAPQGNFNVTRFANDCPLHGYTVDEEEDDEEE